MKKNVKTAVAAISLGTACALLDMAIRRSRRRRLAGSVVLITGGSRGFGLALAREFAALNCRIAILARDSDELSRARRTFAGREVFTTVCDVSDQDAVIAAVHSVCAHYGQIDILLNNAGEITVSPFENLTIADFERAMSIMFWGTVYTTLAVLPLMKARKQGRIVNISSIGGKVSVPHLASYGCAKAAAAAFSDSLRNEVRRFGLEVTTIIPGLMRTGSHVNAIFKGDRPAEAAWFGAAASLPLLSISAEHAARMTVDAVCAGKSERVLGVPAQILLQAQALLPGLMSGVLRLTNVWLPEGNSDKSSEAGRDLEDTHGSLYHLLTTLGREAGRRLNQPV